MTVRADTMASDQRSDMFGDIAVEMGFATPEQITDALERQRGLAESGTQRLTGEILIEIGALTPQHVADVLQIQRDRREAKARSVGPYRIIEKVGAGGMGAVYSARHAETGKLVALKLLPQRLASDARYLARFKQEAEMAAELDHENIVKGLGSGSEGDVHYFAMEFVDGENIQDMIGRVERFPEDTALNIILPVARALEHADGHGLVHQDVKPENIIMDPKGVVKLLDLGLARRADDLTKSTLGTPLYVSPEHVAGDRPLDIRSDIYSLGVTLYHMLTGSPPFVGTDERDTMTRHVEDELPWPQDVVPELSEWICQVLARMLAKSPDDRYAGPGELISDLEALLERRPPRYALQEPGGKPSDSTVRRPEGKRASGERKARRKAKAREGSPVGTETVAERKRRRENGRQPGPRKSANANVLLLYVGLGVAAVLLILAMIIILW